MTQDVRTRPPEGADDAYEDFGRGITLTDIFDGIWRFFISKKTGLALILGMGLLSLAGTLLRQAPSGLREDPQAYQQWLDSVRPRYGGFTTPLNMLGMFDVFSSIWFKAVTVLLAVSILACSTNRAPKLWRAAFQPRTRMPDSFFDRAPLREIITVPGGQDEATEVAREQLHHNGFRVVTDNDDPHRLYADRFRFGPFGTVLAHVAFVVILIGVVLTASAGFKLPGFAAPVGNEVAVGHGTGLTVEARSFSEASYDNGAPKDYASDLVLRRNGVQVAQKTVRVNQPLRYGGVSFYQSSFGTAISMQVKDSTGKLLYDSSVPLQYSSSDNRYNIGQFPQLAPNLEIYVVSPASGQVDPNIAAGQVQVEIHQTDTSAPATTKVLSQNKPDTAAGLTFTFLREREFTGLTVSRDPGAFWVWLGASVMVLGLFMVFFFPHRRMWVHVRRTPDGSEILCGAPVRRDVAFQSRFRKLVGDISRAGDADATPAAGTTTKVGPEDA